MGALSILIVTDIEPMRDKIQNLLDDSGCNVTQCPYVEEADRLLSSGIRCNAIVLDIGLLERGNPEFWRNKSLNTFWKNIPIVPFISELPEVNELGVQWKSLVEKFGMIGAYDIVSRTPEELILVLGVALSQAGVSLPELYKNISSQFRNISKPPYN